MHLQELFDGSKMDEEGPEVRENIGTILDVLHW